MKIAITGTRGIPNRYGGFEELAEQLSIRMVDKGFDVMVFNPHFHPVKNRLYKGVRLEWVKVPLPAITGLSSLVYDYRCLKMAAKKKVDIILNCGYTSSVFYRALKPSNLPCVVTHMDGMEWQRDKWSPMEKRFLRYTESQAVKYSQAIIVDHPSVQDYYEKKYHVMPECISYGGDQSSVIEANLESDPESDDYTLRFDKPYFLVVSRFEPENNIGMVIKAFLKSKSDHKLIIAGDTNTSYGKDITRQYKGQAGVVFLGSIFDPWKLELLRRNCDVYIHGHSVGGTNPSLLQAMASGCLVFAHDNPYNSLIINNNGLYFNSVDECAKLMQSIQQHLKLKQEFQKGNQRSILECYNWEKITASYINLFKSLVKKRN